jgi:hypothetical protein
MSSQDHEIRRFTEEQRAVLARLVAVEEELALLGCCVFRHVSFHDPDNPGGVNSVAQFLLPRGARPYQAFTVAVCELSQTFAEKMSEHFAVIKQS